MKNTSSFVQYLKSYTLLPLMLIVWGASWHSQAFGQSAAFMEPNLLCIKFQNDLPIRVVKGRLDDGGRGLLAPLGRLLDAGTFSKLIDLDEQVLEDMRVNAQQFWDKEARNNPTLNAGPVADLNRYFLLRTPSVADLEALKRQFEASPLVEYATRMPKAVSPPNPPNYTPNQTYLTNSHGIHAEQVYSAFNVRGAGVCVVDIEGAYNASHADLPSIPLISGTSLYTAFEDDHGTAVLGQMVSLNNGWGTTGIASAGTAKFAGTHVNGSHNLANAITRAVNATAPGDVILLEVHYRGPNTPANDPNTQFGFVPAEHYKVHYDAIKVAVGNNRIVVEAAGNGHQNLDHFSNAPGYNNHYPYLTANNSGAILVGAGHSAPSGSGTARSRINFSNYGNRLDVQAFGENVSTTGYPHAYQSMGKNYWFTHTFNGTSSASPIVAGACMLVQSAHKSNKGTFLNSIQMRSLLISTGKAQQAGANPTSQKIGPMPNAHAAIQTFWTTAPACAAPTAAQLSATNLTSSSARLNCSVSGVQAYAWAYRLVGTSAWTELPATSTNNATATGLAANKQYEFIAAVRCNSTTWSAWSPVKTFTTAAGSTTAPSNNLPCSATLLTANSSCSYTTGNTTGATATFNDVLCGTSQPRDVWFRCAIPSSGTVTFRTAAGTLTDAVMAVFWGSSCSSLNYIVCEDDNNNGNGSAMPVIAISGQPGTMLWVRVWGYNNAAGTFRICAMNYNTTNFGGNGNESESAMLYTIDTKNPQLYPYEALGEAAAADRQGAAQAVERYAAIGDAYPNPTAGQVLVPYTLTEKTAVRLDLCDALGRTVLSQRFEQESGEHQAVLDLSGLHPGAYYVRFQAGKTVRVQQVRVMR